MLLFRYLNKPKKLFLIVSFCFCVVLKLDVPKKVSGNIRNTLPELNEDYKEINEKWMENALRDIAYYLRNHKFNEWDRRYYPNKPSYNLIGFYKTFPIPSLKSIDWQVHKHCHSNFFKCIAYLHSVIKTAPFTRSDDISTSLNKYSNTTYNKSLEYQNLDCKKALLYTEKTGLPFDGPKEKFYWTTSASYYMCWYGMKEFPELSMLGETCDNFASCLDPKLGHRNYDPRSNDKLPFACAIYSFCPDTCCPLKHVHKLSECYNSMHNPCYIENSKNNKMLRLQCILNRKNNSNLDQMIENKWNTSCHCKEKGFTWDAQYGMCIDINECTMGQNHCDMRIEDCLNLPGTYQCVCKWGYNYDKIKNKCVKQNFVLVKIDESDKDQSLIKMLNSFWTNFT